MSDRDILTAKDMSPDQLACYRLLVDAFGGENHLPMPIRRCGFGIRMSTRRDLSTTDSNMLTLLVVLAHDRAIRLTVAPGMPGGVSIHLWKRQREGGFSECHPTIEDATASVRKYVRPGYVHGIDKLDDKGNVVAP
jgi:hypothetical protein